MARSSTTTADNSANLNEVASNHNRSSSSLSSASSTSCTTGPTAPKNSAEIVDLINDLRRHHRAGYSSPHSTTSGGSDYVTAMATAQNGRQQPAVQNGRKMTNFDREKLEYNSQTHMVKKMGVMTRGHSLDRDLELNNQIKEVALPENGGRQARGMRLVEGIVVGKGKLEGDRVLFALARSRSVDCSNSEVLQTTDRECLYALPYRSESPRHDNDAASLLLRTQLRQLSARCEMLQRDLDRTKQELGCSVNSIRNFWSPELKKARATRREEMTKNASLAQQLISCQDEVQRLKTLLDKLKQEFRSSRDDVSGSRRSRQQDAFTAQREKEANEREVRTLRRTVEELATRVNQLRDALSERDETISKLVTMLNISSSNNSNNNSNSNSLNSSRIDDAQNSDV